MKTKKTEDSKPVEKKPKHMKKGEKLQPKLNTYQSHVLQEQVVQWILEGKSRLKIIELMHANLPPGVEVSDVWCVHFYQSSKMAIEQDLSEETISIVSSHMYWYEHVYHFFQKINHVGGMTRALAQKEKLLGLRKEDVSIKINNSTTVNFNRPESYDTKKLEPTEKSRLEALLKKASVYDRATTAQSESGTTVKAGNI